MPLLARSIAKELAHRSPSEDAEVDDESIAQADDDYNEDGEEEEDDATAEADDDYSEDAWLTAEKDDGSQRVEAPTASVLSGVVEQLNESGARSA